ncbi:MAG: ABC transporter ATP-binding protein [Bacilli bacterium]
MNIVEVKKLKKFFGVKKESNVVKAVNGIDLEIKNGEFLSIVGTSGSGKTTLLNLLGGIDQPDEGCILIDGHDITKMSENEMTIFRRRNIGFVFQNYNLINNLNIYENIVLPVELDGNKVDEKFVDYLLEVLNLTGKKFDFPNMLSGGQQQRAAIARALATKPAIILADEPTGNLDSSTSQDVIGLIKKLSIDFNQTVIMITHNEQIAQSASRTIRIEDGIIY